MKLTTLVTATFVAASLASAAFAAEPGAPGKGTGTDTSRGAPLAKIEAKPIDLLKVDISAMSRGPLDAAAAVESFTTVTLNKDGSTSEEAASDAVRAVLTGSSAPAGDTAGGVTVGKDDRKQVKDSSQYPFTAIGWLRLTDSKGGGGWCSSALIGPKTVITAAHCVYDFENGAWMQQMLFVPGAVDPENAPFGVYDWDTVHILKGFLDNYDGENYGSIMPWDMAVINLQEAAGDELGWLGFMVDPPGSWDATILGYPADKPEGTMWESKCKIAPKNYQDLYGAEGLLYWHTCDTYGGSSGSSIWQIGDDGFPYVRGINVAEDDKQNYATTINEANFNWISGYYQ
jgi:V8-like Glu-specific endopeptidase